MSNNTKKNVMIYVGKCNYCVSLLQSLCSSIFINGRYWFDTCFYSSETVKSNLIKYQWFYQSTSVTHLLTRCVIYNCETCGTSSYYSLCENTFG